MGSSDEFGPDTETIRAWLDKRASYARDARIVGAPRGGSVGGDPSPQAPSARSSDVTPHPTPGERHVAAGPDSVRTSRSVLAALGIDATDTGDGTREPGEADHQADHQAADHQATDAARSVVDAVRAEPAPGARRGPRTPPTAKVRRADVAPAPAPPTEVRSGRWTEPAENLTVTEATTDVDFPARSGARRVLSVVLLATLAATGVASYLLWREQTTATIGVAVILLVLTLVVWAVRASCAPTTLSIRRGQLSILRGGRTEVVDVGSRYTPLAIVGEPGHRSWRVLIERPGLPLIEITPSMVDAHWFTTALFRLRPELRPGATPAEDDVSRAS